MSTSLAEQLQRLAVPQTARLQQDKKRASLLFDPKEAASLNKETAYQIGIDGLEELKERNAIFSEFEHTLFHITSKDFERSIETAQTNQKLDKNVKRFLYLLSPHFMFNCSYKALEWLVYRYYIHEYNKEDLLMLILPYHETNIFVRTLQLLNLKNSIDKWHWLKPLQKSGVHLTKEILYKNLASNAHFLECISTYVLSISKEHANPSCLTTVYNFYCSSFAGALEYSEKVNELQVSQILPVLLVGLSSKIPDFTASSYIICAQLFSKVQLSNKILNKLSNKICQIQISKLKSEAMLVLLVLYQTQKHYSTMASIRILSRQMGIVKVIEKFNREGIHIQPFLLPMFKSLVQEICLNNDTACKEFIGEILNEVKFDDSFIDPLIRSTIDVCSEHTKSSNETLNWLKYFLTTIENQYPAAFDKAIKEIMKPMQKRTTFQKTLCKVLSNAENINSIYDLMEKLYNPNSDTRLESIKLLQKKFAIFKEKDHEAIENAILDRMNDDSISVACKTLQLFQTKLAGFNMDRLKNVLLRVVIHCQKDNNWLKALPITLDILSQYYDESDVKIMLTVLPFLLPTTNSEILAARIVLKSKYGQESKFLAPILANLETLNAIDFSSIVYETLLRTENLVNITTLIKILKEMAEENSDAVHKYMSFLVLCSSLPRTTDFGVACLVLDICEIYMSENIVSQDKPQTSDYILLARKNKLSLPWLLDCVKKLITKINVGNLRLNNYDLSVDEDLTNFVIRLLRIILKGRISRKQAKEKAYNATLKTFFKHFCADNTVCISEFLLNLVISDNKLIDDEFRINCLVLVKIIISQDLKLPADSVLIPYVLVGLTTPSNDVRKELSDILILAYNTILRKNHSFLSVFCKEYLSEIVMDHEQISEVVQQIYESREVTYLDYLVNLTSSNFPIYFKAGLLSLFQKTAKYNIYTNTSQVAYNILQNCGESLNRSESRIITINIKCFNSFIAKLVDKDSVVWRFISLCTSIDKSILKLDEKHSCPAVLLLEEINREVFLHLNHHMKKLFLNEIIEVSTNTENPEVSQAASRVFKHIDLDSGLVLEQLQNMRDVRSPSENPVRLKRRVNIVPTADILETLSWKKGITVLEFIQDKKKIRNTSLLLPVLFDILKKCLDFEQQANVEYPKQLLLSTILHCCQKMDEKIPESTFDMQLVVQCIRASQNPQTHHHALLLLAEIASLIPKQVLHHIIAIFTFMGSSVLRHDDEYSFQIITKIIDTVTPILIEDGKTESIAHVLRVFVDAVLDIPEHRRMRLFKQLLTRIDAKENLYLFLVIIFEAQVIHGNVEKQKTNNKHLASSESPKRLDIAADLCREFSPEIVLRTCINILQYLCKLPEEKKNDTQNIDNYTFDIQRYNAKQLRHYKYIIILFISSLLSSEQFIKQLAAHSDTEMQQLESVFKEAIIVTLNNIQTTSKLVESHINTAQSQYWKVMLHYSCDTLDAINSLLTEKMFLHVIRGLMVYSLSTIRKRALDLLNNKLQDKSDFINECDKDELYNVIVTPLVNIIKTIEEPNVDSDQEQVIQKALVSLKLLVRNIGVDNPEKFTEILDFTADLVQTGRGVINDNVLASLILCLAELCNTLGAHAISSLHKCMPVLLKLLKPDKEDRVPSLLLTSNIAAINKILNSLAVFLSPFLKKLLCGVSILASRWGVQSDNPKLSIFTTKLQSVQQRLGQSVSLRVLLPAIQASFTVLVTKSQYAAIEPLMKIVCESLNTLKGNDIQGYLTDLTNFFLQALQFRTDSKCENVIEIEDTIIKAISTLVLKLSETTFRPLYYKIFDWAVRTDVKSERIITFYNLSFMFANSLKGLFSLFAGHFLNNAAKLLDDCNEIKHENLYFQDTDKNIAIIENILKTLHTIFLYDSQKFINKERFEVLMQPIVDQLENTLGGFDKLETRANKIVIPCIVQFAVATADDALWKQMNYQILLKTRHNTSKIRLIALNAVGETAKKLGEDFLPLLPETIPFLAELLEDEDETVEKSCQKMLQELEKVLGEPLQKYF